MNSNCPTTIRKIVEATLQEAIGQDATIIGETLLIRAGHYCGHRYVSQNANVIWFQEEQQIKVYNREGHVVRVVSTRAANSSCKDGVHPDVAPLNATPIDATQSDAA